MGLSKMGGTILRKYGQITIIPKPKFMLFWNDSPTKLPFFSRDLGVAIIGPGTIYPHNFTKKRNGSTNVVKSLFDLNSLHFQQKTGDNPSNVKWPPLCGDPLFANKKLAKDNTPSKY